MKAAAIGLGLIFTSGLAFGAEQKLSIPQRPKPVIDIERVIDVLITMEQGLKGWQQPGGALQFTLQSWTEQTNLPYLLAQKEDVARRIAHQRLRGAIETCNRLHIQVTPMLILGSWHHGLSGSMSRVKRGKISDYMTRATNLYLDDSFR